MDLANQNQYQTTAALRSLSMYPSQLGPTKGNAKALACLGALAVLCHQEHLQSRMESSTLYKIQAQHT
jgi:hypothetical protein